MSVSHARESPWRICWIRKRSLLEDDIGSENRRKIGFHVPSYAKAHGLQPVGYSTVGLSLRERKPLAEREAYDPELQEQPYPRANRGDQRHRRQPQPRCVITLGRFIQPQV